MVWSSTECGKHRPDRLRPSRRHAARMGPAGGPEGPKIDRGLPEARRDRASTKIRSCLGMLDSGIIHSLSSSSHATEWKKHRASAGTSTTNTSLPIAVGELTSERPNGYMYILKYTPMFVRNLGGTLVTLRRLASEVARPRDHKISLERCFGVEGHCGAHRVHSNQTQRVGRLGGAL